MTTAAKEGAKDVAASSKEHAGQVADKASRHAQTLIDDARTQLREQAGSQTSKLADTLSSLSSELHSMAGAAHEPDDAAASAVREVADRTGRLAEQLRSEGFDGVVERTKRFGQQRPGLFLAGALAAGFAAGRLLRSADTGALMNAAKNDQQPGGPTVPQLPMMEPAEPPTVLTGPQPAGPSNSRPGLP
jgi:hypothetical protein